MCAFLCVIALLFGWEVGNKFWQKCTSKQNVNLNALRRSPISCRTVCPSSARPSVELRNASHTHTSSFTSVDSYIDCQIATYNVGAANGAVNCLVGQFTLPRASLRHHLVGAARLLALREMLLANGVYCQNNIIVLFVVIMHKR